MNYSKFAINFLIAIAIFLVPVNALDLKDWENQTVNNEFVVSLPPNWVHFPMSSYTGPATALMDNDNIANVLAVQILPNTNCSKDIQENLKFNLESFSSSAGLANLTTPILGIDNVTEYGKFSDGKVGEVFLKIYEGNVVILYSAYESLEKAKETEGRFEAIARSIVPLHPATNDFCASETKGPTPVPTYKPRAVPTVKNTVKPTEQPTPVPTFVFKPISTPTPMPTQVYSATPIPTQVYTAAIIPSQVYSVTPKPTQVYSATPIPTQYIAPVTSYTGTCPCNCNGPDLNCKDFSSHAEAQACFECCKKSYGDCFKLDRDGDGNVCES